MNRIITIGNLNKKEYFFTTDHCQEHGLGGDWVPVTSALPMHVVKRESLPDGVIRNKEDYKKIFYNDSMEIPNPNPEFQG